MKDAALFAFFVATRCGRHGDQWEWVQLSYAYVAARARWRTEDAPDCKHMTTCWSNGRRCYYCWRPVP